MNCFSILIWILILVTSLVVLISLVYVYTDMFSCFYNQRENFDKKYFMGHDSTNIRNRYNDYRRLNNIYSKRNTNID